jgi:adenylate cyclase
VPDLTDDASGLLRRFLKPSRRGPELAQFRDALTREILLTERLRVKVVIITVSVLVAATSMLHLADPSVLDRLSHGQFSLAPLNAVYVPFLLYELFVLRQLARRLKMHSDVSPLSLRADRDQHPDLRAAFAHELDGA